jgi:hypothetical protein
VIVCKRRCHRFHSRWLLPHSCMSSCNHLWSAASDFVSCRAAKSCNEGRRGPLSLSLQHQAFFFSRIMNQGSRELEWKPPPPNCYFGNDILRCIVRFNISNHLPTKRIQSGYASYTSLTQVSLIWTPFIPTQCSLVAFWIKLHSDTVQNRSIYLVLLTILSCNEAIIRIGHPYTR